MQKTLPLYLGPSVIGSVILDGDEHRLVAYAKTYATLNGICRAYIKSATANLLIGVLSPDESAYSAKRTFSKETLCSADVRPEEISYAYVQNKGGSHPSDTDLRHHANELSENFFRNKITATLAKSAGAMVDSVENPTRLAVPLFTGRPFPRPDVLCLMTPYRINGKMFGVVAIDKTGSLMKI